jgi:hypothetical protein
MAFSTTNIDKVRAMAFPAGMLSDGELVSLSGLVLVSWRSSETDKLFQVYVNGRWAGTTSHPQQRMLLVEYEHIHTAAIEIIAVEPAEKDTDYSNELSGFVGDACHAILSWPKRGVLPLGGKANVYWDGGNGQIDYGEPLATWDIWCGQADKWGWGLDAYGKGDFGYSGTGAIGCGRGSFGWGEFGFDAELQEYQSESLAAGTYKFAVRLSDRLGNLDEGEVDVVTISVDPLPEAPGVTIASYDEESDDLVLNINGTM